MLVEPEENAELLHIPQTRALSFPSAPQQKMGFERARARAGPRRTQMLEISAPIMREIVWNFGLGMRSS